MQEAWPSVASVTWLQLLSQSFSYGCNGSHHLREVVHPGFLHLPAQEAKMVSHLHPVFHRAFCDGFRVLYPVVFAELYRLGEIADSPLVFVPSPLQRSNHM